MQIKKLREKEKNVRMEKSELWSEWKLKQIEKENAKKVGDFRYLYFLTSEKVSRIREEKNKSEKAIEIRSPKNIYLNEISIK